ncbi:MAG: hypothetical protein AB1430_05320 [Pseudomonadota bacterium]
MSQEDREYRNQIEKQWGYFAIYPPNRPVELGDYGKRQGDEFEKLGNIRKWIEPRAERKPGGNMLFTSQGDVKTELDFGVADKLGLQQVDLKLTFTKKWSIFFLAQQTTVVSTANLMRVGNRIVEEYQKKGDSWQRSYEWVTELVEAEVLTVMVATESGAVATLSGKLPLKYHGVPVGDLDLRDFGVTRNSGSVSVFGPCRKATPLHKLFQVEDPLFKKAHYEEVR